MDRLPLGHDVTQPSSPRLAYTRVEPATLNAFHTLVTDDYVRRYLMDGEAFPREWSEARIRDSAALFERRGVGLWLVEEAQSRALVGFCGFLEFPDLSEEPQLVYALFERFAGMGYATEMARAAMEYARSQAGFEAIVAGVDAVNDRSCRVLDRLGFVKTSTVQGAFGDLHLYVAVL
jgi:RimJ/RimL family protein N-acetyltransferase